MALNTRTISIIGLVIILILVIICTPITDKNESFIDLGYHSLYTPNFGRYCGDCGSHGRATCSQCTDCGYCINYATGRSECVPGDENGPYFRKDCSVWEFNYPWINYMGFNPRRNIFPIAAPVYSNYPMYYPTRLPRTRYI